LTSRIIFTNSNSCRYFENSNGVLIDIPDVPVA
jgi:hypothetical protein